MSDSIILGIAKYLPGYSDLSSFERVSKRFYREAMDFLLRQDIREQDSSLLRIFIWARQERIIS